MRRDVLNAFLDSGKDGRHSVLVDDRLSSLSLDVF